MTTVIFQGRSEGEEPAKVYGELKIEGVIQLFGMRRLATAEVLLFENKTDYTEFLDAQRQAEAESLKNDPYLRTRIIPDDTGAVYDVVGERVMHEVSDIFLYQARHELTKQPLPILPPYAKR